MSSSEPSWPFVVNLSNSIIGVSMLALPYCMEQCGILLGCLLVLATAYLTRVSCFLLLRSSQYGRRKSYETLAVTTYGPVGKLLVEISMIGLLLGTCTAFFVIIGDLAPAIVAKMFGVQETPTLRAALLISVALAVVLPLSLKNNINALTGFSTVSLIFYGIFVFLVVYFSMPTLFAGEWSGHIVWFRPRGTFSVLPILSLAFSCQAQVFVLYEGLQDPSVKKMTSIINQAVNLVTVVYLTVGIFGYFTYYKGVSGDVLNNFPAGILTQALKLAFALSVVIGYPLMVFPCRLSINSLFSPEAGNENIPGGALMIQPVTFRIITLSIVAGTLTIAVLIPNVEFILQLSGCVMGSLICYVFPGLMFLRLCSPTDPDKWKGLAVTFLGTAMLLVCTMAVVTTVPEHQGHQKPYRPQFQPAAAPPRPQYHKDSLVGGEDSLIHPPHDALRGAKANTTCGKDLTPEQCTEHLAKLAGKSMSHEEGQSHNDGKNLANGAAPVPGFLPGGVNAKSRADKDRGDGDLPLVHGHSLQDGAQLDTGKDKAVVAVGKQPDKSKDDDEANGGINLGAKKDNEPGKKQLEEDEHHAPPAGNGQAGNGAADKKAAEDEPVIHGAQVNVGVEKPAREAAGLDSVEDGRGKMPQRTLQAKISPTALLFAAPSKHPTVNDKKPAASMNRSHQAADVHALKEEERQPAIAGKYRDGQLVDYNGDNKNRGLAAEDAVHHEKPAGDAQENNAHQLVAREDAVAHGFEERNAVVDSHRDENHPAGNGREEHAMQAPGLADANKALHVDAGNGQLDGQMDSRRRRKDVGLEQEAPQDQQQKSQRDLKAVQHNADGQPMADKADGAAAKEDALQNAGADAEQGHDNNGLLKQPPIFGGPPEKAVPADDKKEEEAKVVPHEEHGMNLRQRSSDDVRSDANQATGSHTSSSVSSSVATLIAAMTKPLRQGNSTEDKRESATQNSVSQPSSRRL